MNPDNQNSLIPIDDLLAINDLPLRESDFTECMDELLGARIKTPFVIVVIFSALFYAIVLASVLLNMKIVSMLYVAIVSLSLLIALFFRYSVSKFLGRLRYKQYCLAKNNCHQATVFYKDHLEIRAGNEIITQLAYSYIRKVLLTENLIIITQAVEKPCICVKHKPGFCHIDAKEEKGQMEQVSPAITTWPVF